MCTGIVEKCNNCNLMGLKQTMTNFHKSIGENVYRNWREVKHVA